MFLRNYGKAQQSQSQEASISYYVLVASWAFGHWAASS